MEQKVKIGKKEYPVKTAKRYSTIFYILGGYLILSSFFIMPVGILFLILGVWLVYTGYAYRKAIKNASTIDGMTFPDSKENLKNAAISTTAVSPQSSEPPMLHVPQYIGDCTISYKYEDVEIKGVQYANPDFELIKVCDKVKFVSEPTNEYDKNAILAMHNDIKLGYAPKNNLQKMIHDWQQNNNPIFSAITSIDKEKQEINMFLAFYKNVLDGIEKYASVKATLTKTSKKTDDCCTRQDSYGGINEGEQLELQYDYESESYTVMNESYEELGEISKSISSKLQEEEETHDLICVLQKLTENDDGKCGAKVAIYLKPKS